MKRRQMVRRLEIVVIVAVVVVSLVIGFYLALFSPSGRDAYDGKPVSLKESSSLYLASQTPYGESGLAYLKDVHNITGIPFVASGKPVLVYVGADYCLYCAVQRWTLIVALNRFGNFSNLSYMTSSAADGDYSTFTFTGSHYQSNFLSFQSYELDDRGGKTIATLPTNYTAGFKQYGNSAFPFLNFANRYAISGAILDPAILGSKNWTEIITSIQTGTAPGGLIKQGANLITSVICKATGEKPAAVCGQSSISSVTSSFVSYSPQTQSSGSELFLPSAYLGISPSTLFSRRDRSGWN
jgi:hypothetical protein